MPGPSTDSEQTQTRGPATTEEGIFAGLGAEQATLAGQSQRAITSDPRMQLASLDQRVQDVIAMRDRLQELRNVNTNRGEDISLGGRIGALNAQIKELQSSRPLLEEQISIAKAQEDFYSPVRERLRGILMGTDLGISPEERALITQGISGISQDVSTSRGLNRTDVPVMQAIAPAISQALLAQANANRSLLTGVDQFQQGLGLSNRQLQLGLAGQNPAANLTGVYSGLRSTSMTGSEQKNYGALDYVQGAGSLAQGIGGFMYGMNAGPGTPPPK